MYSRASHIPPKKSVRVASGSSRKYLINHNGNRFQIFISVEAKGDTRTIHETTV